MDLDWLRLTGGSHLRGNDKLEKDYFLNRDLVLRRSMRPVACKVDR